MQLSIVTTNIEYGNKNKKLVNEKSNFISKYNSDLILVQECDRKLLDFSCNYDYIDYCSCKNEMVEIYLRKDSDWKINSKFEFDTELSYTIRSCKVLELINNDKLIKIANIHLCGGRFDENDNIGKMLIGNIKEIRSRKNEVIKKLIDDFNIDIIAGDFNSDLNCYLNNGNLQKEHLNYFQKISPKKSILTYSEWNVCPYRLLNENNYNLAYNKDNNYNYTSIYKTHPDSVWYKSNLFNQKDYNYIDLISKNYSDHNGIYVNFFIKR